jgi:hypothetical protein
MGENVLHSKMIQGNGRPQREGFPKVVQKYSGDGDIAAIGNIKYVITTCQKLF